MSFVALPDLPDVACFREKLKPVSERSDGEKMALMKLRYGNDLAKACVAIGRKIGWPEPAKRDWRVLFDDLLIKREGPRRLIVLTSSGLMTQAALAHAMARLSGLHFQLPATDDRYTLSARCTCGWSAALSKNQGHLVTGQIFAFSQHMDAVAKGIWKQPRSVDEIFDEAMAKRDAAASAATTVPAQTPAKELASQDSGDGDHVAQLGS